MFGKNKQRLQEKFAEQTFIDGPIGQQFGLKPPPGMGWFNKQGTKRPAQNRNSLLSWFLFLKWFK
jgi:hypothetical protein